MRAHARVRATDARESSNGLESASPNLVEGRELYYPRAIAFDASVTPPHVYIADTGNNRVLGWSNANKLSQGDFADLVVGQPDFYSTVTSGPGNSTGLNGPTGIAVDTNGNLYVADSGNNRIMRFKAPYKQPANDQQVDLVIGQKNIAATSGNANNQGQGLQSPSSTSLYSFIANSRDSSSQPVWRWMDTAACGLPTFEQPRARFSGLEPDGEYPIAIGQCCSRTE